jgi:hypothetical protein
VNRHIKKIYSIFKYNKKRIKVVLEQIEKNKDSEYIVFYNPECNGVTSSVNELFDSQKLIKLEELFNRKEIETIATCINENCIKQVVFSTMAFGYKALAEKIYEKNKKIKIDFLWHGSHALFVNKNEEFFLESILDLCKRGIVSKIGFLKESMYEFYKNKGYNSYFLKNTVTSISYKKDSKLEENNKNENIKIGLYSSGDRWEKNVYNQLSACAMVKDSVVDIIPNTKLAISFCELMNINQTNKCLTSYVSKEKLFSKMKENDVNLYVTFSECAPMVPLESFALGVPCIIGDNTHYFKGTKLEEYLVVKSEDNIDEIYEKINLVIKNKKEIMELYNQWKNKYDEESKNSVISFLNS